MNTLLIIILDGIIFASWLFLVSAGLTLIFGVLRILNVAHGSLYALGAFTAASFVSAYLTTGWAPAGTYLMLGFAALAAGLVSGPLIERGLLRQTYSRREEVQLLVTYALFLVLEDVIQIIWGTSPYHLFEPYRLLGRIQAAGIVYPTYNFLVVGVALLAGVLLWLFINRTRFGRRVVAVIHDREISTAMGINVSWVYMVTFTLGAIMAALGGAITAPMSSVSPGIAVNVIVLAFAVVVIGGLGSLEGAALGAIMVGLVRAAAIHLIPELELFTIYLVMVAVLLFRPHGLFGREQRRI